MCIAVQDLKEKILILLLSDLFSFKILLIFYFVQSQ